MNKLEEKLNSSQFWENAFIELELSLEHLKKQLSPCKSKVEHWLGFRSAGGFKMNIKT